MHYLLSEIFCFFAASFGWDVVQDTRVWRYIENRETGERRVIRIGPGSEPIHHRWLLDTRQVRFDENWPELDSGTYRS
jgi:phage protein U